MDQDLYDEYEYEYGDFGEYDEANELKALLQKVAKLEHSIDEERGIY